MRSTISVSLHEKAVCTLSSCMYVVDQLALTGRTVVNCASSSEVSVIMGSSPITPDADTAAQRHYGAEL